MPKELATLKQQDPEFQNRADPSKKKVRKIRHFIFLSVGDDDTITVPMCVPESGNPIATRNIRNVTCPDCLQLLLQIQELDSHQQAVDLIKARFPNVITPDPALTEEVIDGLPTPKAQEHLDALSYLKRFQAETPDDLPLNTVGSTLESYYATLLQARLIDSDGEVNTDTRNQLLVKLNELQIQSA